MQIAQIIAGYSLGGADLLRRAMGKKKAEEMAQQRAIFVNGALAKGHSQSLATRLFDLMEKFAEYGFNKSHTAATQYSLIRPPGSKPITRQSLWRQRSRRIWMTPIRWLFSWPIRRPTV